MTEPKVSPDLEAMREAYSDIPSQDNEGYTPDRGGFKCGWFAALRWERDRAGNVVSAPVAEMAVRLQLVVKQRDVLMDLIDRMSQINLEALNRVKELGDGEIQSR